MTQEVNCTNNTLDPIAHGCMFPPPPTQSMVTTPFDPTLEQFVPFLRAKVHQQLGPN